MVVCTTHVNSSENKYIVGANRCVRPRWADTRVYPYKIIFHSWWSKTVGVISFVNWIDNPILCLTNRATTQINTFTALVPHGLAKRL